MSSSSSSSSSSYFDADLASGPNVALPEGHLSQLAVLQVVLATLVIAPLASLYSAHVEEGGIAALKETEAVNSRPHLAPKARIPSDLDALDGDTWGEAGSLGTALIGIYGIFGAALVLIIFWPLSFLFAAPTLSPIQPLVLLATSVPIATPVVICVFIFGFLLLYKQLLRRTQAFRALTPYEHDMRRHLTVMLLWAFGLTSNYFAQTFEWPVRLGIDGWNGSSWWFLAGCAFPASAPRAPVRNQGRGIPCETVSYAA